MIRMTVNTVDLSGLVGKIMDRTMTLVRAELWGNVRKGSPVDTGNLANSWSEDSSPMRVYTDTAYAANVSFGTGPRIIRPKNKKALYWKGARHPVRKVNHPGTKANPYVEKSISKTEERIDEFAQIACDEIGAQYGI
jgi:hypothetical protein